MSSLSLRVIIVLDLLGGCGSQVDDTGPVDTALGVCDVTAMTPQSAGEVAAICDNGVCELSGGEGIVGAASPDHADRCPSRVVSLSGFALDQTEVTSGNWQACVDAGRCDAQPEICVRDTSDSERLPITCITHSGAAAYCEWVGGRLPTEAEWEVAARGRAGASWPWGEAAPSCNRANYRFVAGYCWGDVAPVGEGTFLGTSPFGLKDMAGNVWEWVADWYDAEVGLHGKAQDPIGPEDGCRDHVGDEPGDCSERVLKGGAWNTTEGTLDPASRSHASPGLVDLNVGFRCAYDR